MRSPADRRAGAASRELRHGCRRRPRCGSLGRVIAKATAPATPSPAPLSPAALSTAALSTAPMPTERRRRELQRHLRWLGADPELAEDLAQETLLRLWRTPPAARDDEAVAAWLRAVARNLFRSAAVAPRPGVPLDDEALLEAAWRAFARGDGGDARRAALDDCLRQLPARARQVVELHYRHGLGHAEIADAAGLRPAGVKRLLQRTRALLADCIERRTR